MEIHSQEKRNAEARGEVESVSKERVREAIEADWWNGNRNETKKEKEE